MRAILLRLRPWALVLLIGYFVGMECHRIGDEYMDAVALGWPDIPSYGRVPEPNPEWRPTGMLRCRDGRLERQMVKSWWVVIHRHEWWPAVPAYTHAACPF